MHELKRIGILAWLLICIVCLEARGTIPKFLKPCENNENLSRCSRQVLEEMRPHLVRGIPELGLKSIDPMRIQRITRTQRNSNVANYRLNMTNVVVTGSRDYQIEEMTIGPDNLVIRLKLVFPQLRFDSDGDVDGVIVGFSLLGFGSFTAEYTNVVVDIILNGEPYWQYGNEFVKWKMEDIEISYADTYFSKMHGFFEDPSITHLFKIALNRSIRLLGTTMRAAIVRTVGDYIVEAANSVHRLFPKDVLYPSAL